MTEEWKELIGWPGYYVSNHGRVKHEDLVLKTHETAAGYPIIRISSGNLAKTFSLGKLVAEYFIERPEGAKKVCYIDKDPANCHASNLQWIRKKRYVSQRKKELPDYRMISVNEVKRKVETLKTSLENIQQMGIDIGRHYRYYEEPEEIRVELRKADKLVADLYEIIENLK